ncbi:sugar ABC transporter ATPase [Burkholderia cepacia]
MKRMAGHGEAAAYWADRSICGQDRRPIVDRRPRTTEITMNKLLPTMIALLAGGGIGAPPLHAAGTMDAPPCSAAHAADRGGGNVAMPGASVRSFSTAGCSGAVLQGDRATAIVDGDRVELRDGVVYVNGRSYGAVTPAQTVEYEAARERRTLKVDGKIRAPLR